MRWCLRHVGRGWVGSGVSSTARSLVLGGLVAAYRAKWLPVLHHVFCLRLLPSPAPSPQKHVYSPFSFAIEPSSASLVALRMAMSIWYLPSSLAMRAVLLSGLEEAYWSWRIHTFHAPKTISFCCCCCCCWVLPLLSVKPPVATG